MTFLGQNETSEIWLRGCLENSWFQNFFYCKPSDTKLTAQEIINKTIRFSRAHKVSNSEITFNFRDRKYIAIKKEGCFRLGRLYKKELIGTIEDEISNNVFKRLVNKQPFKVADSMVSKYSNSINSVRYFSVLPFGLNDTAVRKKLLPSSTIKGKSYFKVEVNFSENGGGEDFEGVFIGLVYET